MVDVRGLGPGFAPSSRVSSLSFSAYSAAQLTSMSVKKITNPETFDSLLHPNLGGLYDPALGPTDKHDVCSTCGLNYVHCPGHMGHISLPLPVYHPLFFTSLYQLLQASCWACHRLFATPTHLAILQGRLALLGAGRLSEAAGLEAEVMEALGGSVGQSADSCVEAVFNIVSKNLRGGTGGVESSRNVIGAKHWEVQEFLRQCSRGQGCCPHCQAPARPLRQDSHVRIFLKGLSKKQAGQWRSAMHRERGERWGTGAEGCTLLEPLHKQDVTQQLYVSPIEVKVHIEKLWEQEGELLKAIFEGGGDQGGGLDLFFLTVLPVPPSRFRPISQMGEKRFENPQSVNLQSVLSACAAIHQLLADREREEEREGEGGETRPGTSFSERLQFLWCQLQGAVNVVMDSSKEKKKSVPNGIKQILERKEGLFRMNMMGKRVDFAARSVISPDPYINMDEIGIPMVFAKKLTYPQPVTAWNVKALRQAVINGPNVHPGATHVQLEDGSLVLLNPRRLAQRMALARQLLTPGKRGTMRGAPKKVFRHLQDGDVLLMNRQPTLHKPSIMAHKARVLPGEKTMRLHYANCKCYNADFDGDEMNAHFPQNELARAEAYNIVSTHSQYLVPKDGTPLSGLIQDHVVSGLLMTLRGRHFYRHDYHQLVLAALPRHHRRLVLLPPCHLKPAVLWSGKQVVSTVLLNIIPDGQQPLNLLSKAKISPQEWGRGKGRGQVPKDTIMTESEVVFRGGQLLCGVLDKSQFGASQFGFVHSCQELYGGGVANQLLSALGCLFTTFLQLHGFTLGVEDILVTPEADKERKEHIQDLRGCGQSAAADAFTTTTDADAEEVTGLKYAAAHRSLDPTGIKNLDYCFSRTTSKYNNLINMACVPAGLYKPFPSNSLQLMVQSGAKGSTVNCMQISCLLGQIELEGQRPPLMPSGSFLPSFPPYDTSPRAGGFVEGRFLTGIRPQEYFFHCMAGREGLVDTAVKTSRSGYLQRCLIKHLEGLTVNYDLTVRDSDGSVVQFLYGEDGLDVCHSNFLQPSLFPFLLENHMALTHGVDFSAAEEYLDLVAAHKHRKKLQRWAQRHGQREGEREGKGGMEWRPTKALRTAFLLFSEKHLPFCQLELSTQQRPGSRSAAELQLISAWYSLSPQQKKRLQHKCRGCLLPALSMFRPDRYFGSIPEKLDTKISSFLRQSGSGLLPSQEEEDSERLSVEKFESLIQFKYLRSLAQPGEAVGLLAAQSIGEPSTQMTLNTFHFAGRGEMNVTLGIPRLREILMTASPYIKTPAMEVPLQCLPQAQARGEQLKKHFTRVCLNQVLEQAEVWETIGCEGKGHRYRQYTLKLSFLPHHYYQSDYVVTPSQVLCYVEKTFVRKLVSAVKREIKLLREKRLKAVSTERERAVSGLAASGEGGEVEVEEAAEESDVSGSDMEDAGTDATAAKDANKKKQHSSYEDAGDSDHDAAGLPDEEGSEEGDGVEAQRAGSEYDSEEEKEREEEEEEEKVEVKEVRELAETAVLDQDRVYEVISSSEAVVGYSYDPVNELFCTLTLKFPAVDCKVMLISVVERLASKCVVWEVPHIYQGFLSHDEAVDQWILKTDGVNLQVLREYGDVIELNRVYTNSIHSMADTYGIEAAVTAIVREISTVFAVYNIAVDPRHLSLIADYMTFEGSYKPFNRIGLEANSSPLQKMSFETTMNFLKTATLTGSVDKLTSPSACLVAGRVVHGGTGAFELLQSLT